MNNETIDKEAVDKALKFSKSNSTPASGPFNPESGTVKKSNEVAALPSAAPGSSSLLGSEIKPPGSYFNNKNESPQDWLMQSGCAWMENVVGDTPLNRISIPGTHDSGALHGGRIFQTQVWTIQLQLNAGIRFFDIRCRPADSSFKIYHSWVYQERTFDDVMKTITTFLTDHPSETIIMRVQTPKKLLKTGRQSIEAIWNSYMDMEKDVEEYKKKYRDYFHIGPAYNIPKLDQMRGKILVMRENFKAKEGITWGDSTTRQDNFNVTRSNKTIKLKSVSLAEKKKLIEHYIDKANNPGNEYVINFLSGALHMYPDDVAEETNKAAYEYIGYDKGKRNLGILVIDFPGDCLIQRIIDTN